LTEMDKEVSDNSMDSTLANVNGRLEKLAADTEPTIVYSSEREVAATHHLRKVLGIHRDTNDGLVAEHIRRQIDMKYIEGMVWTPSEFFLWCPGYEFYSNLKQMLPWNYRDLGSLCRRGAACTKVC